MDDVYVMDAEDEEIEAHRKPPANPEVNFLLQEAGAVLVQYGWFLLLLAAAVFVLIQHLNRRRRSLKSPSAQTVHDPVSVARRQEALEASRKRMQEELDAKAEAFREKQRQLEEEKRRQKIEMWDSMQEGRSYKANAKSSQDEESSATLKPKSGRKSLRSAGYSPLSGEDGGACSWRPGRRGPSSGG